MDGESSTWMRLCGMVGKEADHSQASVIVVVVLLSHSRGPICAESMSRGVAQWTGIYLAVRCDRYDGLARLAFCQCATVPTQNSVYPALPDAKHGQRKWPTLLNSTGLEAQRGEAIRAPEPCNCLTDRHPFSPISRLYTVSLLQNAKSGTTSPG